MQKKIITQKKTIQDPDIVLLFNQMVGNSEPDLNIVIPKYEKIINSCTKILGVLNSMFKTPLYNIYNQDYAQAFKMIDDFKNIMETELKKYELEINDKIYTGKELNELNKDSNKLQEFLNAGNYKYKITNIQNNYKNLKQSVMCNNIVITTKNIKSALFLNKNYSENLKNRDKLSAEFIINGPGENLELLSFSNLNFKQIIIDDRSDKYLIEYILYALRIIYNESQIVLEMIMNPDIDIDHFIGILIANIDKIKTYVPRCDEAFDRIKKSASMLKENFNEYYKDFVQSNNPNIFIENFIGDVAKSSESDIKISMQFKRIIEFYKKNVKDKVKDEKINKLFSMADSNLDSLNKTE